MEREIYNGLVCAGLFLLFIGIAEGQDVQQPQPSQQAASSTPTQQVSQNQALQNNFLQARQALLNSEIAQITNGATPAQLDAWFQQNAPQFAALQQHVQAVARASALQPMPTNRQPNIPANASQTLKDFLTTRAALANALAQIHNQLLQSMPANASADQVSQMQQNEMQTFEQQHAGDLQLQAQRAQVMASQSANQPVPVPPPLSIPAQATPQMAAFLTTRDQLMREQIQLQNQYLSATPAVREAAMQQWLQQNASRFQQLQQQAQALAQTTPTITTTTTK